MKSERLQELTKGRKSSFTTTSIAITSATAKASITKITTFVNSSKRVRNEKHNQQSLELSNVSDLCTLFYFITDTCLLILFQE
jgi:hypothetical protein